MRTCELDVIVVKNELEWVRMSELWISASVLRGSYTAKWSFFCIMWIEIFHEQFALESWYFGYSGISWSTYCEKSQLSEYFISLSRPSTKSWCSLKSRIWQGPISWNIWSIEVALIWFWNAYWAPQSYARVNMGYPKICLGDLLKDSQKWPICRGKYTPVHLEINGKIS